MHRAGSLEARCPAHSLAVTVLWRSETALLPSREHLHSTFLINHIRLRPQHLRHEIRGLSERCEMLGTPPL